MSTSLKYPTRCSNSVLLLIEHSDQADELLRATHAGVGDRGGPQKGGAAGEPDRPPRASEAPRVRPG